MEILNLLSKIMAFVWPALIVIAAFYGLSRYAGYISSHFADTRESRVAFACLTLVILAVFALQEVLFTRGLLTQLNDISPVFTNRFIQFTLFCLPFGVVNFFLGIFFLLQVNRKIALVLSVALTIVILGLLFQRYFPIAAA